LREFGDWLGRSVVTALEARLAVAD
jgi:hypothetical protein